MITARMSVIGDGCSSLSLTVIVKLLIVTIASWPTRVASQGGTASSTQSSDSMSSGAMIGIIIAGLCLLLIVIGSIVLFLICRKLSFQHKPSDSAERERRDQLDLRSLQETGCGLPVDIPVEALTREPPPRYASVNNLNAESPSVSGRRRSADVAVVGDHPPPYCEVSRSGVRALDQRADFRSAPFLGGIGRSFDSPPLYQSRVELDASRLSMPEHSTNNSHAPARALPSPLPLQAGSVAANPGRLHSVDSFRDIPSMSDVLLTSSRTSLPTSASAAAAMDAATTSVDVPVAVRNGRSRRNTHSATPSAQLESTISGRSAAAGVTGEYSRSTIELSTSAAAPQMVSTDRRQENRDGSSRHDRRVRQMQERQRMSSSSGIGVAETSMSVGATTTARNRTASNTIVESIREPQPQNRGRRATGSDQTSARLPSVSHPESLPGGVAMSEAQSDGVSGHHHRRRNNTNQRHEHRSTTRTTSQSLPRLSLVDEEQRQSPSTTTSSTTCLELVGYGSVV